jgi:hypothetical protein
LLFQSEDAKEGLAAYVENIAGTDAVQGRIQYPRPLMLRMSSVELLAFSARQRTKYT